MNAKDQLLHLIADPAAKATAALLLEQLTLESAITACERVQQEASATTWGTEVKQFAQYIKRLVDRDKYSLAQQVARLQNPDFEDLPL